MTNRKYVLGPGSDLADIPLQILLFDRWEGGAVPIGQYGETNHLQNHHNPALHRTSESLHQDFHRLGKQMHPLPSKKCTRRRYHLSFREACPNWAQGLES